MPVEETENYIRIQIRKPEEFQDGSMRTVWLSEDEGIKAIMGKLKGDSAMTIASVLFDKEKWSEDEAREWVKENVDKEKTTEARKIVASTRLIIHNNILAGPGQTNDADRPKARDGMHHFFDKVIRAINAAEYNQDFILEELYQNAAIVVDFDTGEYYKIDIAIDGDDVVLGEPMPYDITYTPADRPDSKHLAARKTFRSRWGRAIVKGDLGRDKEDRPVYDVLLVSSGFTSDGRYFEIEAIKDAVEQGMFDGVPCFYQHPDADGDRTGSMLCAFVQPGSVRLQNNKAGGVDVFGYVVLLNTTPGKDIQEILDASLKYNTLLLGNSIYGSGEQSRGTKDGHNVTIITRFREIKAVDFVEQAALPRAGAKNRVAAETQNGMKGWTMDEKQELKELRTSVDRIMKAVEALTADVQAGKEKVEAADRNKAVDALLSASSLNDKLKATYKPILLAQENPELRKQLLDAFEATVLAAVTTKGNAGGPTDANGDSDKNKPIKLHDEVQKVANSLGISAEDLNKANEQLKAQQI